LSWDPTGSGVVRLPSGRMVRGRGLRRPLPAGRLPDFSLFLAGRPPPPVEWSSEWLLWRDFWLPGDRAAAKLMFDELWQRSGLERVEIACGGGRGRTGTALACLAVIDGVAPDKAVEFVREHYDRRAVETPWQRR
jgi:hypothetical protein